MSQLRWQDQLIQLFRCLLKIFIADAIVEMIINLSTFICRPGVTTKYYLRIIKWPWAWAETKHGTMLHCFHFSTTWKWWKCQKSLWMKNMPCSSSPLCMLICSSSTTLIMAVDRKTFSRTFVVCDEILNAGYEIWLRSMKAQHNLKFCLYLSYCFCFCVGSGGL